MKVTITKNDDFVDTIEYPVLMRYLDFGSEFVVLFDGKHSGMVVAITKSDFHKLGDYRKDWVISKFSRFNDTVSLSN